MPDDFEPISRAWNSQGLKLHYLDWGNAAAPVLLLLHGNGDHARSWDWTARALCADWRVIAPDLRGHGDSQWSPDGAYLTPYHVLDIADLIDSLGDGQVTIVAHSFGGVVALRYAALFPDRVRKLAIIDGMGPSPAALGDWEQDGGVARTRDWIDKRRRGAARTRLVTVEQAIARLRQDNPRLSEDRARHLALHGLRRSADLYAWKLDPLVRAICLEDFMMEKGVVWRHITAPTLVFHAPESWKHDPADDRVACFRDARTVTIEQAGHWLHHDQFDAFIAALRDFL